MNLSGVFLVVTVGVLVLMTVADVPMLFLLIVVGALVITRLLRPRSTSWPSVSVP